MMILFDYECPKCGRIEERLVNSFDAAVSCSCGTRMSKVFSTRGGGIDWFKPGYFEHITDKPVFVESKRHLKELCEKHGCYSVALLNENKGTGVSQEIKCDPEVAWKKVHEHKRLLEVANDNYRKVFGDV